MLDLDKLPGKVQGEKVELVLRRHWYIFFKAFVIYGLLLILPPLLYYFIVVQSDLYLSDPIYGLLILLMSSYYLFIWLFFFNALLDHYLDIWIVTNKRILNIEQKGLFSRTIAEQKLYRVQDVTSEVIGFIETFLNFGNVYVQTAGALQHFIFKDVPNPSGVVNKILSMLERTHGKSQDPVFRKKSTMEKIKDALLD